MKSSRIMFFYAGFLLVCGLAAYFMAPSTSNPATALYVSAGTAALMIVCGLMARRLQHSRVTGMIGIHAGLLLPLLFAALFAIRSYKTFDTGGDQKRYLAVILAIMAAASIAAFFAVLATRPPKAQRIT